MSDPPQTLPEDYFHKYTGSVATGPAPEAPAKAPPPTAAAPPSGVERAAEIGGAGALGAGALALGSRFPALRRAAAETARYVAEHPLVGGGAAGAVAGGAAATPEAVSSGHPGDILVGAGTGAAAGASGAAGLKGATGLIGRMGTEPAERAIAQAHLADSANAQAASARLRDLAQNMRAGVKGPVPNQQTVGESLGPQGQALATAALKDPAQESQEYAAQLAQRQAETPGRTAEIVNQGLKPDDYQTAEQQFLKTMRDNAKPLYDAAYAQFPSVQSDTLNAILGTKFGKIAGKKAFALMQADGVPIGKADATGMITAPSLQYLDYVKRALDDQIGVAQRAGANNEVRIIKGMRDRLLSEVDQNTTLPNGSSPYAEARSQYQGDRAVLDALHSGAEEFASMTPAEVRAKMLDMDFSSKDAFRSGVAESLFRQIGKPGGAPKLLRNVTTGPDMQEKIAALFDNPKDGQAFIARLEQEATNFDQARTMMAAGNTGAAAGVTAEGSIPPILRAGVLHSLSFHPKVMALRAAAHALLGHGKELPSGGISSIMSGTGLEGANSLDQLAGAVDRLQKMKAAQTAGAGLGAVAGGAGAGALLTPEIARHDQGMPLQ